MRVTDFHLAEVSPVHLDAVDRGGRRTRGTAVRKLQGVGNSTFEHSVENDNDFRSKNHIFSSFLRKFEGALIVSLLTDRVE